MKKIILTLGFAAMFILAVVGMSAYEAHVVNVTATIENAVSVDTAAIDFGTVYPQEAIDETFEIKLSQSFLEQDRVDKVDYVIRQKPKCWSASLEEYGLVAEDENNDFYCADEGDFEILPILCPFLSKHEISDDGEEENDSEGINAFHGPISGWNMQNTLDTQAAGQLINIIDTTDEWQIDLRAPCFAGSCAQDWAEFVTSNNPLADPDDYVLPESAMDTLLGCDLWIEVSGIGESGREEPLACTDVDLDTFSPEGGLCGLLDCDDDNPNIYPGAAEVCDDGLDNDCDQATDCQDSDCAADPACASAPACIDGDGDGYGTSLEQVGCLYAGVDCDDTLAGVNPGAAEVCNGLDDDCDGYIDEGWEEIGETCSVGVGVCEAKGQYICNPNNPASIAVCDAIPGSPTTEICDDGLDNDCDGLTDGSDDDCQSTVIEAGDVIINEVSWMGTTISTADEWIELKNTTGESIDLAGWTLNAIDGTPAITLAGSIGANSYFLLERTDDTSVPDVTADQIYTGVLGNSGENLELRTGDSTLIDGVDGSSGWQAGDSAAYRTMERCPDKTWHTSAVVNGTPSALNSACTMTSIFSDMGAAVQYGYTHDYSGASASFTYNYVGDDTVSGTVAGTGLKPYATYQLKFEGTPTCADAGGDDAMNETIGYLGRWWSASSNNNVNDIYYEANKSTDCITGYLVWGHVTADASGNFSKAVETGSSYHVLWCDSTEACGGANSNISLGTPDILHSAVNFCGASDVYGEEERACSGQTFGAGAYDLKMILNEESFHQGPGTWTAVMNTQVDFIIY